jgi:hypothetical protein
MTVYWLDVQFWTEQIRTTRLQLQFSWNCCCSPLNYYLYYLQRGGFIFYRHLRNVTRRTFKNIFLSENRDGVLHRRQFPVFTPKPFLKHFLHWYTSMSLSKNKSETSDVIMWRALYRKTFKLRIVSMLSGVQILVGRRSKKRTRFPPGSFLPVYLVRSVKTMHR